MRKPCPSDLTDAQGEISRPWSPSTPSAGPARSSCGRCSTPSPPSMGFPRRVRHRGRRSASARRRAGRGASTLGETASGPVRRAVVGELGVPRLEAWSLRMGGRDPFRGVGTGCLPGDGRIGHPPRAGCPCRSANRRRSRRGRGRDPQRPLTWAHAAGVHCHATPGPPKSLRRWATAPGHGPPATGRPATAPGAVDVPDRPARVLRPAGGLFAPGVHPGPDEVGHPALRAAACAPMSPWGGPAAAKRYRGGGKGPSPPGWAHRPGHPGGGPGLAAPRGPRAAGLGLDATRPWHARRRAPSRVPPRHATPRRATPDRPVGMLPRDHDRAPYL
jgi:hypothetical protein